MFELVAIFNVTLNTSDAHRTPVPFLLAQLHYSIMALVSDPPSQSKIRTVITPAYFEGERKLDACRLSVYIYVPMGVHAAYKETCEKCCPSVVLHEIIQSSCVWFFPSVTFFRAVRVNYGSLRDVVLSPDNPIRLASLLQNTKERGGYPESFQDTHS